jgi:ADP-heptose:LPS heptosyltransferase
MPPPVEQRVLVIRRRYLGDVVLLGSVLRNLRLHWPQAHLAALVEEAYAGVLDMNPDVNTATILPRRARDWPRFLRQLRQARFTHVFDFDNNERTACLARFSGAPFRATVWHEGPQPRFGRFYTHRIHDPPDRHERRHITEYFLSLLAAADVPVVTRDVRLTPRETDVSFARNLLVRHFGAAPEGGTRLLLIHPGSRSAFRIWPPDRFARICDLAGTEPGVRVAVVGAPNEQALVAEIARLAKRPPAVIDSRLTVSQLAALASLADLVLCHDSGPMHVAAAVGTRVVALLGSQNPVVFAPPGQGHIQLQPPLPCTTCVAPGQCVPGDSYRNYCVRNLTVEQVFAAIRTQLAGPASAS